MYFSALEKRILDQALEEYEDGLNNDIKSFVKEEPKIILAYQVSIDMVVELRQKIKRGRIR